MRCATGREVIDVLESVTDLDWFRYARADADGVTTYAPITVWRFKSPDTPPANRLIRSLRVVLDGFSGKVLWSLKFSGRNWMLLPKQAQELEDSGRFRTDCELLDHLRAEAPDLGPKALEDLVAIADGLARQLQIQDD